MSELKYIKFKIRKDRVSEDGTRSGATIARLESNMADVHNYELNLIMHALSLGDSEDVRPTKFSYTFPFGLG